MIARLTSDTLPPNMNETPTAPTLPEALSLCSRRLADKQTPETPLGQLRNLQTATLLCDVFAQTFKQQPIEATAADFLGAALWLHDWYAATAQQMSQEQSSLILTSGPSPAPPTAQLAEGFRSLAATWQAAAQAMAEVLPGESVTATIPGALRIWTAATAALVGGATSGTDRRQVVILTTLLRQVSGEAAALAMGYGREETEAAVEAASPLIALRDSDA